MTISFIQSALSDLTKKWRVGGVPCLAVLGPPSSGKSAFLSALADTLRSNHQQHLSAYPLTIDLRSAPVGPLKEIYHYILHTILEESPVEPKTNLKINDAQLQFETVLRNILSSHTGKLVLIVDHLDSVPHFMVRTLSRRFRQITEHVDDVPEFKRLGLVVAGTLSLFELRHDASSPFLTSATHIFPKTEAHICRELVGNYLESYLPDNSSEEVINLLADETQGEMSFLEQVFETLRKNDEIPALSMESLKAAINEVYADPHRSPIFRQLALHLWGDKTLRATVEELIQGGRPVPRSLYADIDRLHLTGAVVITRNPQASGSESYRFRNRIVGGFFRKLLASTSANNSVQVAHSPIQNLFDELESIKLKCLIAQRIWDCIEHLREAWERLTPHGVPNTSIYVMLPNTFSGWWLDSVLKKTSKTESPDPTATVTETVAYNAAEQLRNISRGETGEHQHLFWGWNHEQVALGIQLHSWDAKLNVIVITTLNRVEATKEFSETSLCHWIRFVQDLKERIVSLSLAEIGHLLLMESDSGKGAVKPVETASAGRPSSKKNTKPEQQIPPVRQPDDNSQMKKTAKSNNAGSLQLLSFNREEVKELLRKLDAHVKNFSSAQATVKGFSLLEKLEKALELHQPEPKLINDLCEQITELSPSELKEPVGQIHSLLFYQGSD